MPFSNTFIGYGTLLATLLCLPASALADGLSEDRVKAGFILNFVKYTEWPPAALAGTNLRVCSPERRPLSGELLQLQGRQAQGRGIEVLAPVRQEDWRSCHVLFIPAGDRKQMEATLDGLARGPVLTISDSTDFIAAGGMIGLKQNVGRIRFDINLASARRAGLGLSSQLLKLAEEVRQ
jgi:hypothetical protein